MLYVVREITEEVDTSFCFEFFDIDNIWLKGDGSVIVFVFEPEGNSFILPVTLTSHFVFHQCCREEISRYNKLIFYIGVLVLFVNCTATTDE